MNSADLYQFLLSIGFSPKKDNDCFLERKSGPYTLQAYVPRSFGLELPSINGSFYDGRKMADTEGLLSRSVFDALVNRVGELGSDPTQQDVLDRIEQVFAALPEPESHIKVRLAIADGNVDQVRALLQSARINPDVRLGKERASMIHFAQSAELIEFLIGLGVDVNQPDRLGQTPLFGAASVDKLSVLLLRGASPHQVDRSGRTALHNPQNGAATERLLAAGALPHAVDSQGTTPLHHQVSLQAMSRLIAAGAKTDAEDGEGHTPLTRHLLHNRLAQVGVLLASGADVHRRNRRGETPIFHAKSVEALQLLIGDFEAGPAVRCNQGRTALHGFDQVAGINLLCQLGLDPNSADVDGVTPLHQARVVDVVRTLLAHGAEVNSSAKDGRTPLHWAVSRADHHVIKELLARGADPQAEDAGGDSPLHLARTEFTADCLIRAGANPKCRDRSGELPKILESFPMAGRA